MSMTNNGAVASKAAPKLLQVNDNNRTLLNTYIYEYFLGYGMFACARAILISDPQVKAQKESRGGRLDENGNLPGNGLGDGRMDTDSKEDMDSKIRLEDLPAPNVPNLSTESCFLYEWFCLFWDMFNAQKGKGGSGRINQYASHTQQNILCQAKSDTSQYQIMRMLQQKQDQHRGPSDMGANRSRPASPGPNHAPYPSKRRRLAHGGPFNPNQSGIVLNGRPAQGMPGQQGYVVNSQPPTPSFAPSVGPTYFPRGLNGRRNTEYTFPGESYMPPDSSSKSSPGQPKSKQFQFTQNITPQEFTAEK